MASPVSLGLEYFVPPDTANQGLDLYKKIEGGKYPTSTMAQNLVQGKPVTGLGGGTAQMMYHGTKPQNVSSIMQEGFKPKPASGGFSWQAADVKMPGDKIFTTPSKPMAQMYAGAGKPIPTITPTGGNWLPSGAVSDDFLRPIGAALKPIAGAIGPAAAGYSIYDAGQNLMEGNYLDAGIAAAGVTLPGAVGGLAYNLTRPALENAGFGDWVQELGLADSSVGQSIAEALMGYKTPDLTATPDYSQMISTEDILNFASNPLMSSAQADPIAATRPITEQQYQDSQTPPSGPTMADVAGPTVDYEPTVSPSGPTMADVAGPVGPTPEEIRQQEINDYMQLYNTHMGNISVGSNPTKRQVDDAFRFFGPYGVTGVPGWLNESSPDLNSLFRDHSGIVEALQFGGYTPQTLNESMWESYINPVDMPTNTVFSQAGWVDPYEGM